MEKLVWVRRPSLFYRQNIPLFEYWMHTVYAFAWKGTYKAFWLDIHIYRLENQTPKFDYVRSLWDAVTEKCVETKHNFFNSYHRYGA